MARALGGCERRAQLPSGPLGRGDEGGVKTHPLDQPQCAPLAGFHVAGEMHAANQALPREFGRSRQQDVAAFRRELGE
jgi:hypothetical protein